MPNRKIHPLRRLWPLVAPYSGPIGLFALLGIVASLVEALGIGMMIPLLQGQTLMARMSSPALAWIDTVTGLFPAEHRSAAITAAILGAMLVKALLAYGCNCLAAWIRSSIQRDIQIRVFRQILAVSQEYLETQHGGTLLRTLTAGPPDIAASTGALLWLILNVCALLVFATILMVIAWQLTLAVVVTLLVFSKLVRWVTRGVARLGQKGLGVSNELSQICKEILFGIRTVRAFGRESHEEARLAATCRQGHHVQIKRDMLAGLNHPLSEVLAASVMVGLVFLALQAGFPLSVLVTVAFLLYRLHPQIQNANANLTAIVSLSAPVEAVTDLLNEHDKPYLRSGERPFEQLTLGIRFEKVSFAYSEREDALGDINLDIEQGKTTALVGRSGAGKSTLVHLLCRFYDPTAGKISADGTALPDWNLATWRERIALVSQDVHIFSSTVRENIAYGRLDATEAEIIAAATRAHAHEFIVELPEGYDTLVGDRGMRLSGGQRQRLSIARAILRDPDLLILDEATNALDTLSEAHIQAAIEELGRNRTVVVVAHRLSTIERADRIVVLEKGRIVEQGTFGELVAKGGMFAALYRSHSQDRTEEPIPQESAA